MAKIFYSLSGEGRGHAARVRAMVEALKVRHEVTLFAPGDAYQFLAPLYRGSAVQVRPLRGLLFQYNERRRLDYVTTLRRAIAYLARLNALIRELTRAVEKERPDLVVTDFEPALPRAARRGGIPFVSLSHQHFLLTYDLSSLPRWLRWRAAYMSLIVRAYYSGQRETIVSSFYFPPLRRGVRRVTQVGVLMRPEVLVAESRDEGHLVAYLRRFAGPQVLKALRATGREVRVYGLGQPSDDGPLKFCAVNETTFLRDLASCSALITTAGNQLVGEALYLRKPVFAMPEAANYEQYINAHFLAQSGAGEWAHLEQLDPGLLARFLERLPDFVARIDPARMNGLPPAVAVLERCLASAPRQRPRPALRSSHAPA